MRILKVIGKPYFYFTIIFVSVFFILPRLIKTREIKCYSQFGTCNERLSDELKVFEGKNIIDSKREIHELLKKNFTIESYHINYKLPSDYEVRLLEKKPKFAVTSNTQNGIILIDNNGSVVSSTQISDLPKLLINGSLPKVGESVDGKILFALNLLHDTYISYQTKEGRLENEGLVIELPGEVRVIFPLEGDREVLSGSLILLYSQITHKDEKQIVKTDTKIDTIDLRFKNPILRSG